MSDYLKEIGEVEDCLRNIGHDLIALGRNFYNTGNPEMGEYLTAIGKDLLDANKQLSTTVGSEIHQRCNDNMQFTGKLVEAVLDDCIKPRN